PAPGLKLVCPRFEGEQIPSGSRRREPAEPAIVAVKLHRLAMPVGGGFRPPQQRCGNDVVPVAKNIGPDFHRLARNAFNRIAATVDAGIDILDAKAWARGVGCGNIPSLGNMIRTHWSDHSGHLSFRCSAPSRKTQISA